MIGPSRSTRTAPPPIPDSARSPTQPTAASSPPDPTARRTNVRNASATSSATAFADRRQGADQRLAAPADERRRDQLGVLLRELAGCDPARSAAAASAL